MCDFLRHAPVFEQTLAARGRTARTRDSYLYALQRFDRFVGELPLDQVRPEHLVAYQRHLAAQEVSWSTFNINTCALRFFYREHLGHRDWDYRCIPFQKHGRQLPEVLAREELPALFEAAPNPKYRAVFMTGYACGLRLSEILALRPSHIDSKRMVIRVERREGSKGPLRHAAPAPARGTAGVLAHLPPQAVPLRGQGPRPATRAELGTESLQAGAAQGRYLQAKPPLAGPQQVVRYVSRYTRKIAISNSRILDYDGTNVRLRWRDRAHGNRPDVLALSGLEFARRFVLHILPPRFVRIRHYGLLANRVRQQSLARCRALLSGGEISLPLPKHEKQGRAAACLRLFGKDPTLCPACGQGRMHSRDDWRPTPRFPSHAEPRPRAP